MRTFYHLLGNTFVAMTTNMVVWFAITYFAYLETHSVLATSIIAGLWLVLTAVSGFWLGAFVDRYRKKNVMLGSSIFSISIFAIAFALYLAAPEGAFSTIANVWFWSLVILCSVGVTAGNVRPIALATAVTLLFPPEDRDKANGLSGMTQGFAFLIISVISGFLVAWGGMFYVFIFALVFQVAAIMHLLTVSLPEPEIVHTEQSEGFVDIRGTIQVIAGISGLFALIFFTMFNNFLGGVFMSLMDPYGLELVSVQVWGLIWGFLGTAFIVGGALITKYGVGHNPMKSLMMANLIIWTVCIFFAIQPSIILLIVGSFIYLAVMPYIEASEHTVIQKIVPPERQGRVFGFAQSVEMSASPLTAFMIGPIAQYIFIPFMTTGAGVSLIGDWFGVGPGRGMALVFTIAGLIGVIVTLIAFNSRAYKRLSAKYLSESPKPAIT